jgi:hypothetical protein
MTQPTDHERLKDEAIEQLYAMVQDAKTLLSRWGRSGAPRNEDNRVLRADTRKFMRKSSSQIVLRLFETRTNPRKPRA